jgi:carbamoyl-phosphate synthase large subunit
VQMMINTTAQGAQMLADSFSLRRTALMRGIPHYTTMPGARAAIEAIAALQSGSLDVAPIQDYLSAS